MIAMNPSDAISILVASGMTEQAIAAELKVNQTTVNRIRRRVVTPSYETGRALIDLATAFGRKAARRKPKAA
ncbi:helix-turn-helix domain-containing protein [Stenotrophomonas sp.]|uniref:helix-turn-helix domain-containing protein n=1 Tax=Stenotrophomonas sp. TaxID=69392 RepID=UPI00289795DF|nr:helix-turn-helix domain-containing protein [Stenotrophomonas sp.]